MVVYQKLQISGRFINIKVQVSTEREKRSKIVTTGGASQVAGPASGEVLAKPVHDS